MAMSIQRREFIGLLSGTAAAWPLTARAQQPAKRYLIGWLQPVPIPDAWLNGFRQGLREFNYVEGKDLIVEYRWGDGNFDRLPAIAAELVRLNPDVLISGNTTAVQALQKATRTIPIVMLGLGDPLAMGLVAGLARPGGNITGLSGITSDVSGKRLELLKELIPTLDRVAVLVNPENPQGVLELHQTRAAAQTLGFKIDRIDMGEPGQLDRALSIVAETRPDALNLLSDSMIMSRRDEIAIFAVKQRLPSISPFREFTQAGGLMSYGANLPDLYRRGVRYISQILRGANPGELPIEQPTKFDLALNLKTARAIGIEFPWFLQQRAEEVIE
jgi:putative tryptophan/tyrosine transport system substrate-binding protein